MDPQMLFIKRFSTIYCTFSGVIGMYQAVRGFNATHQRCRQTGLFYKCEVPLGDRLGAGLANGIIHVLPGWNLLAVLRLINRVDIQSRGLKKEDHYRSYEECREFNLSTFL